MMHDAALPATVDGGSPTSCSAHMDTPSSVHYPSLQRNADATRNFPLALVHREEQLQQPLQRLLGESLSDGDRARVQLNPLRTCQSGEIVAVQDSDGVLRYGQIADDEDPSSSGELKVQVSKVCIRWYAVSQIRFFQAVGATKGDKQVSWVAENELRDDVVAEVNALQARLNVSLSTSYEELLAEILRLQHRAALAEEDRRAALKQMEQALREKRDAEKALVCVVCLVSTVDRVLIPCGHSYCSTCVERLHRESCPVCRQDVAASAAFRVS